MLELVGDQRGAHASGPPGPRLVRAIAAAVREHGESPFPHAAAADTGAVRLYGSMGFALRRRPLWLGLRTPGKAWGSRAREDGADAAPRTPRSDQAGAPEVKRRSRGERTRTDLVRSTKGSPAIRSSTRSKCRMSEANTWTRASASPVTVDADTTSG